MGSAGGDTPRHSVNIKYCFAVSRHPISFEQWDLYCDGDGDAHRPYSRGRGRRPIVNVSWEDAEHYVHWLSIASGRAYRLLSESEWEYCGRSQSGSSLQLDVNLRHFVADAWHDGFRGSPRDGSPWGLTDATMWRVVRGPGIFTRERVSHTRRTENITFHVACGVD
jgi:formylglycine-generating enzyme required for sulfatase activity